LFKRRIVALYSIRDAAIAVNGGSASAIKDEGRERALNYSSTIRDLPYIGLNLSAFGFSVVHL
jgi:hypothetical protein